MKALTISAGSNCVMSCLPTWKKIFRQIQNVIVYQNKQVSFFKLFQSICNEGLQTCSMIIIREGHRKKLNSKAGEHFQSFSDLLLRSCLLTTLVKCLNGEKIHLKIMHVQALPSEQDPPKLTATWAALITCRLLIRAPGTDFDKKYSWC